MQLIPQAPRRAVDKVVDNSMVEFLYMYNFLEGVDNWLGITRGVAPPTLWITKRVP